jgi:hypothetical protein
MPTRRVMAPDVPAYNKHPDHHFVHCAIPGLREARIAKGWSLQELAEISGYRADIIAEIEASPTKLYPRMVSSRLSAFLGITHDQIRGIE